MGTLLNRNFILLWQGQVVSQIGNQAYLIALMFWLLEHTGSVALMGTVAWFRYAERPSFVALNLVGVAVLMLLLGAVKNAYALVAVMVGLGFLTAQINILVFTFLQMRTPKELRGRVLALVMALAGLAVPIGLGAGAVVVELTGRHVIETYFLLGSVALAVTVAGASSRSLRAFLGSD